MNIEIRDMIPSDIMDFYQAFQKQGWDKPIHLFQKYYDEQCQKQRQIFVATADGNPAGYATLMDHDKSGPFANMNIPTVCDFNVLIDYQKNGIGTMIFDAIEESVKQYSDKICLGVGLHRGYGSAQKMYIKRGYLPDGSGVWYNGRNLEQNAVCKNDDELILYLSKELNTNK